MIKSACILILLLLSTGVFGQSPLLDQWFLNNYLVNPAITGIERYWDVQVGSRFQWTGVDGAPESYFISTHTPLGNPRPKKGFTKTPNPSQRDLYNYNNFKHQAHHGVGGIIYLDQIGPFRTIEFSSSYAYHLALNKSLFLSAGLSVGLFQQTLNFNKVSADVQSDPAVTNFKSSMIFPLRPGIWLYGDKFYLGAAYSEFFNSNDQNELRTSILTMGYRFDSNLEMIHLTPYGLLRLNGIQNSFDIGLKVDWKRLIYAGGTYRSTNETVLYVGASINFLLGFTYLYNVGSKETFTYGSCLTHEIQLNFRFNNKEEVPCPQKMW